MYSVNPITGEIVEVGPGKRFESMDEAKRAGWLELHPNRKQRRAEKARRKRAQRRRMR